METVESLKWLRENNLYDLATKAASSLKKVFTPCLAVKNEKILIVGDMGYENRNVAAVLSGLAAHRFAGRRRDAGRTAI